MTFKIGDRVKILPASTDSTHVFAGQYGRVIESDNDDAELVFDYLVAIDNPDGSSAGEVYFFEAELEHI